MRSSSAVQRMVVCQNKDCNKIISRQRALHLKDCDHIAFPKHPHAIRRSECKTALFKTIRIQDRTNPLAEKHVTVKTFCCQTLQEQLHSILQREEIEDAIIAQAWKRNPVEVSAYRDVYDGSAFSNFPVNAGVPDYYDDPYNLVLQFRIDWFQPLQILRIRLGLCTL